MSVETTVYHTEKHYQDYSMNKNTKIFEDIVDNLMLNYFDETFKNKIQNLPNDKKRMMILALLDKDRNLFMKAKALIQDNIPKLKHIKDLILILREYVHVGEVEKKKHGEVMTPLELVKEMLATLPTEVWSNPDLKWLDSCNGTGPFLSMVVYKLMVGLEKWEPDENKRYKHIVENMIYAGELQPKNMFLWITLMDPYNEFNMNVYTGSFLDEGFDKHMKEVWGIEKFDIVVGNPPYQDGSKTQGKNSSLWTKFVIKSNELIKQAGYICYITPSSWIAPSETQKNELKNVFFSNNLLVLNTECGKFFDVASTFSYYLIKKEASVRNTLVNDYINFDLNVPFLPNIINKETLSICSKIFFGMEDKLNFSSGLRNDEYDDNGIYKVWYVNTFKNSNKLGGNYNIKKIVVNKPGYLNARYDNGEYNTSANNYWVEVNTEKEGNNLLSFFNTNLSKFILDKLCKYSGYNSLGVLKRLPKMLVENNWTDENLYNYFGLTEDEIKFVNKI